MHRALTAIGVAMALAFGAVQCALAQGDELEVTMRVLDDVRGIDAALIVIGDAAASTEEAAGGARVAAAEPAASSSPQSPEPFETRGAAGSAPQDAAAAEPATEESTVAEDRVESKPEPAEPLDRHEPDRAAR